MSRHRQFVLSAVVAIVACTVLAAATQQPVDLNDPLTVPRITLEQFRKRHSAGDVVVVDVRSDTAFKSGHIPGAFSAPLAEVDRRADEIRKKAKDRLIVTYCSCPAEHSAAEAALQLYKRQLKNISALVGGYPEWVMTGGAVER